MTTKDSLLTVRFEALGRETTLVSQWSIESNYTTSTDGFDFTLYDEDRSKLRRLELQPVELLVDGKSQLLGRIDTTEVGNNGTAVHCSGRDYLADAVECNVDPLVKIKDGDTVASAFLSILSPSGIDTVLDDDDYTMRNVRTGISVKNRKSRKSYAKATASELKAKPGQGQYDFCNQLIARFGATLQPGPTRNSVVVTAPRYDQEPTFKLYRSADPTLSARNNVESSTAVRDFSSFPTFTLFSGWQTKEDAKGVGTSQIYDTYKLVSALAGSDNELAMILADGALSGRILPDSGTQAGLNQLYRLLTHKDEKAKDQDQIRYSAARAIAERLKETLVYTATIKGHVDEASGAVWSIDTIVQVEDEICDVNENLWIASRTLSYMPGEGAMTNLICYRPASFQFGD